MRQNTLALQRFLFAFSLMGHPNPPFVWLPAGQLNYGEVCIYFPVPLHQ